MSLGRIRSKSNADSVALYRRKYKRFVVRLSKQLNLQECEELFYVYKDEARLSETLKPNLTTAEGSPLRLLEALEKGRQFCCYEPQKLRDVFSAIERDNLVTEVESFVANNEEAIQLTRMMENDYAQCLSPNCTLFGNVYTQATELDGPYRSRPASDTSSIPDGAYVRFQRPTSTETVTQNRELPSVPQVKSGDKKDQLLKRTYGIRKKKRRPASVTDSNDVSSEYSYIDSRTLRLDLSRIRANEDANACQSPCTSSSSATSLSPPPLPSQGLGVFTSSSSEDRQGSSPDMDGLSDSSDDHIYEYLPDSYPLQLVASEPRPLVEEKIRVLVRPIQKMIQRKEKRTVSTDKIPASHHSISNVFFQLRISTSCQLYSQTEAESHLTQSNSFVSAELYLLSDSKFPDSLLLQAKIQVCLPKRSLRKQKGHKAEGRCDFAKSFKTRCICEQAVPLELPIATSGNESLSTKENYKPLRVASFTVMTHRNFLNEKIVGDHHLNMHLLIREY